MKQLPQTCLEHLWYEIKQTNIIWIHVSQWKPILNKISNLKAEVKFEIKNYTLSAIFPPKKWMNHSHFECVSVPWRKSSGRRDWSQSSCLLFWHGTDSGAAAGRSLQPIGASGDGQRASPLPPVKRAVIHMHYSELFWVRHAKIYTCIILWQKACMATH